MCGITAICAYHPDAEPIHRQELEAINARMIPRGPDAGGTWIDDSGRVGLGSRRLAIIDLSADASQPMHDGELTIVFNGEIYNHRELRDRLERADIEFRTHSDTEVLLKMFRRYGEEMVELLRGMFAFTIWDARKRRLFVARDPYGIKPLYFADDGRTFRAASTVKALLAGGAVSRTPDPAGAAGFFLFGHVPEPFTTFEAIRSVDAGTFFFVGDEGRTQPRSHYSIASVFHRAQEQRTIADLTTPEILLRERVTESVRYHLVSDVPIGVFLSAGIDSATITALAAASSDAALHTVTILFDEFRGSEFDETADADAFASSRGAKHTTRVVTRDEFMADLPKILDAMDQPTIDGVNTWFASKAIAEQGLKVALSGVGGDELFGSYPAFKSVPRIVRAARLASRIPMGKRALSRTIALLEKSGHGSPKAREIPAHGTSFGRAYLIKRGLFMPSELSTVLPADAAEEGLRRLAIDELLEGVLTPDPGNAFGRVATLEASFYMRNQLLRDTDWASMAHSVEVRTPLVDAWLLRQLAPLLVQVGSAAKDFFAASTIDALPESISQRPKTGFVTPIPGWLELPPDQTPLRSRSWARRVFEQFE